MRTLIFISFIFILIFGCSQQDDAIVSSISNEHAGNQAQLFKPPAQSGPFVVRIEDYLGSLGLIISDEKSGLTAFLAVDNEAWCSGEGLASFDIVPLQEIDVPEDPNRYIRIEKGEVRTTVHEGVFSGDICEFVANHPKVAEGTSNLVSTDNDLLTYLTADNVNANAFGARAKGELTTMGGEKVDFMAITRTVWDGVDFDDSKTVNKVSLK